MARGHKRIIVQQPPRTGKTVIMADIARQATAKGNRVMFIIHRREVLDQAVKTFKQQGVNMNLAVMGMVQNWNDNRHHRLHLYKCDHCGFTTNDDRIGAMNLYDLEKQYLSGDEQPKIELTRTNAND